MNYVDVRYTHIISPEKRSEEGNNGEANAGNGLAGWTTLEEEGGKKMCGAKKMEKRPAMLEKRGNYQGEKIHNFGREDFDLKKLCIKGENLEI